jgi:hypothetical protein
MMSKKDAGQSNGLQDEQERLQDKWKRLVKVQEPL